MPATNTDSATYSFRIGPLTPLVAKQGTRYIGESLLKMLFALNPQVPIKDIALSTEPTVAHIFVHEKEDIDSFKKVCPEKVTIRVGRVYGSANVHFGKEKQEHSKNKNFVRLRSRSQSVSKTTTGTKLVRARSEYVPSEKKQDPKLKAGRKGPTETDKENRPPVASRPPLQASESKDSGICDDAKTKPRTRAQEEKNRIPGRQLVQKLAQAMDLGVENCDQLYPDGMPFYDGLTNAKVHELKGNATTAVLVPDEKSMKLYTKVFTSRLVYFVIDKLKRHLLEGQLAQLQKSGCNKRLSGAFLKKGDMVMVMRQPHGNATSSLGFVRGHVVARYPHADSAVFLLYLPDYGVFTKDSVHNMITLSADYAKLPFLAAPCTLAGLSNVKSTCYAAARSQIRKSLADEAKLFGYVIGYERDFALVQIGCKPEHEAVVNNAIGTVTMLSSYERVGVSNDLGLTLAEEGECEYKPPPNISCFFTRQRLTAIRELIGGKETAFLPRSRTDGILDELKR